MKLSKLKKDLPVNARMNKVVKEFLKENKNCTVQQLLDWAVDNMNKLTKKEIQKIILDNSDCLE